MMFDGMQLVQELYDAWNRHMRDIGPENVMRDTEDLHMMMQFARKEFGSVQKFCEAMRKLKNA